MFKVLGLLLSHQQLVRNRSHVRCDVSYSGIGKINYTWELILYCVRT